ncbi:halocyanin domain-containing protein [Halapricum desulfuricans]|uniref:Plastocyanin n=1 Tax=Halapricum desulfuricans TaxID=2841257 RepID=A0A897N832_9EURY|nr:halocyanin domain-containing protein [Halapricum desulfuricans]QSG08952.1 Plastocyanin [Halapricum desulfuricans]
MALSRRTYLALVGGTAAVAGCSTGGAQTPSYDAPTVPVPEEVRSYLSDTGHFEGEALDLTDREAVDVAVGAEGNSGNNAYSPPAIQISPGTTVVWEWIRGSHNVIDTDGTFESDLGTNLTFEHTFEDPGTYTYYCSPHRRYGMKGAVVVESA